MDILGKDIIEFTEESRNNGKILQAFNSNFVVTVPKEDDPTHFSYYRPISLCIV